ncbi:uncharacterized protein LOC143264996 [Megachile rotundata]|uniref:uncharacterized protein LOC143264996 n=1 Tax=Megachile rotundata TaxID=143995 RepID=UPI003FD4C65C
MKAQVLGTANPVLEVPYRPLQPLRSAFSGVSVLMNLKRGCAAFQDQQGQTKNVFALHHYKALEIFLTSTGLNPYCATRASTIRLNVVFYSFISGIIPLVLELYVAIQAKDIDEIIDVLPHIFVVIASLIKFGNIYLKKDRFKILLDLIVKDWETLTNELHVLDKVTATGDKLAYLYRMTLLSFLVAFNYIPLIPPTLDIILPLNETRPRQQLFQVNYIFFDVDDHFFAIYLHMSWAGSLTVFVIVTIDSLYMLIIHHASGLFDVCGYQVQMACKQKKMEDDMFKQCVITHHKALEFLTS